MQINNAGVLSGLKTGSDQQVVSLEKQLGVERTQSNSDPDFDEFYRAFMAWAGGGVEKNEINKFLKEYVNEQGESTFRTAQKQVDALTSVLAKMKESGLEGDELYRDVKASLVSVSATNMFISQFMADVFKPDEDEDSRENADW
ncbi:hypothetical protein [Pseudomonas fluorescens]|uniref:Uncharacterized protein n=1 Tax=Pseudomonas fluorescens TaxID=294 RepID=A0A5E7GB62_PSEFL|nr:hypothetical protein [Pseudomonas fluorescens]VVO48795.1 hypothetical protein PS880_00189 [Pseudomonas fluorescens]